MKIKLSNYLALFCFALSLVFVGRAILATGSTDAAVDLQAVTEVSSELAVKPASVAIEEIRIGDRVLAHNPEESDADRSRWTEPYWNQWLTLDLEMQKEGGGLLQIQLLRSRDWLEAQLVPSSQSAIELISSLSIESASDLEPKISAALSDGLAAEMDLPELGLTGHAKVLSIGRPPLVESGAGQVVTATFRHSSVDVIDLTFKDAAGIKETLGTTSNHPFWSVDRQEYVQAGSLTEDERLLTLDGRNQQVAHAKPRIGGDPVFNIEVHQEHVYFVGDSNVLVHNTGNGKYANSIFRRLARQIDEVANPNAKLVPGSNLSRADFQKLRIDPDDPRGIPQAISEVETAIAAERAGLLPTVTGRGDRGADLAIGSTQVSVKRPFASLLDGPKGLKGRAKLEAAFRANPKLILLLDARRVSDAELKRFVLIAREIGIPESQIVIPPKSLFPVIPGSSG